MHLDIWRSWTRFGFFEPSGWECALLALEALLGLAIVLAYRRDFTHLSRSRLILLFVCLAAPPLLDHLLVIEFARHSLLPPPGVPFVPPRPFAPLLGMVPLVVAGAWLGPGPALVIGLVKGGVRVGMTTGVASAPFYVAILGFLVGFLLRQDYRGRLPLIVRQPVVAVPLVTPLAALLLLLAAFVQVAQSGLSGLDYAVTLAASYFWPMLIEGMVAAVAVQIAYLVCPRKRPAQVADRVPPYSRTLNRRLLCLFVPLITLMTGVVVCAVTATAIRLATSEVVSHMARDANNAAESIPYFIETGQGLLSEFASDERLWRSDKDLLQAQLRKNMRIVVFFDRLLLLDSAGDQLALYPPRSGGALQLTSEEQALLRRGVETEAPQISSVHRSAQDAVILSFLAPVADPSGAQPDDPVSRLLLARTRLDANLIMRRVVDGLQWAGGRGTGFIVDADQRVVAHPNPERLLTTWTLDQAHSRIDSDLPGWAYRSRHPQDNTRQLIYYLPVEGYPWQVVIRLPYQVVLEQAVKIAAPLLGLQVLLGAGLVIVITLVTNWVTQPLKQLATAADRIAKGDLSQPVRIGARFGQERRDEIARVGIAFEDMRVRLKGRMEDLSLLLGVSQSVSATLSLNEGLPFVLEGALRATGACVARVVMLSPAGVETVVSRGEPREDLGVLDEALVGVFEDRGCPLTIENLARARTLLGTGAGNQMVEALVALPVRTQRGVAAVMWVGYTLPRRFSAYEIDLLSTLASQTAVLVENARLFQAAEGERSRLAAILASTTDAVVVTDRRNRILLANPAAEGAFDIQGGSIAGLPIDQTPLPRALVEVFQEPLEPDEALTRELPLPDGRTLYASLSAIRSAEGECLGGVCVMRDITRLKELDELKSEFVAAVSHDLRSPLAVMDGYARMIPDAGEVNRTQQEYVNKVLAGVSRMTNLVDDLLNLRRIEGGAALKREPCHLGAIVTEAVERRRARAAERDISLRLELDRPDGVAVDAPRKASAAVVLGDAALLRQAVTNLVDNAIKYTPVGGEVSVGLSMSRAPGGQSGDGQSCVLIDVTDTGIGIAPEDQVRLFEKFHRIKRSDVPDVQGTGLGLSIVKAVIERHGGTVRVESELDQGSTFTIALPCTNADRVGALALEDEC